MKLIFTIAWRNIMRHKGKSLIIGAILFLGAMLLTVGNGIISGMERGMAEYIVQGFTGHIVIAADEQESDDVFMNMMGKSIAALNNYPAIKSVLQQQAGVDKILPIGKNMVMALNEEGTPGYFYVIGADWQQYQAFFGDNLRLVEGRRPVESDREWMLMPTSARKDNYDLSGIWFIPEGAGITDSTLTPEAKKGRASLIPKSSVVFLGFNEDNSASDVRVTVKGVTKYRSFDQVFGQFALMDIESYRSALGYFAASEKVVLDSAQNAVMTSSNLDDMFASGDMFVDNASLGDFTGSSALKTDSAEPAPAAVDVDEGAYNLVCVKLKPGQDIGTSIAAINKALSEQGCHARAIPWNKAIGVLGSMAMLIKAVLFGFVMFLFFVAIIIIINTLSMAALERTSEIGMMRAVGAKKGFIAAMFTGETACLSCIFGGAGILAGIAAVWLLALLHLEAPNDMVQLLYGGLHFRPQLTTIDLLLAALQLFLVTVLAVIYPLKVALGITPLDAISRD